MTSKVPDNNPCVSVGPGVVLDLSAIARRGINMEYKGGSKITYQVMFGKTSWSTHTWALDPRPSHHCQHLRQRESVHNGEPGGGGGQEVQQEGGQDHPEDDRLVSKRSLQDQEDSSRKYQSVQLQGGQHVRHDPASLGHQAAGQ